eukprot:m.12727 g.12727  ORF g.12727 m.12727 type:complete len:227 (+) comp4724_c0_seq1:198-878(+)
MRGSLAMSLPCALSPPDLQDNEENLKQQEWNDVAVINEDCDTHDEASLLDILACHISAATSTEEGNGAVGEDANSKRGSPLALHRAFSGELAIPSFNKGSPIRTGSGHSKSELLRDPRTGLSSSPPTAPTLQVQNGNSFTNSPNRIKTHMRRFKSDSGPVRPSRVMPKIALAPSDLQAVSPSNDTEKQNQASPKRRGHRRHRSYGSLDMLSSEINDLKTNPEQPFP